VVRGTLMLTILGRLIVSVGILLIEAIIMGFVFSELYLSFWSLLTFGIFTFFLFFI